MSNHRILALGDSYMAAEVFARSFARAGIAVDVATMTIAEPTWDAGGIAEFEGDPAETAELVRGYDIVVFHGAPFTAEVFAQAPELRLLACARGGPVNVDIEAAAAAGVRVTTTPGKNAEAVADLTIGFVISLVRQLPPAIRDVEEKTASGGQVAESTFEGARWFGREIHSLRLGLVGYGNVARLVAARARALGATVTVFDPYLDAEGLDGVDTVDSLDRLLESSDVLSLHARATADNRHMIGAREFGLMPPGSFLVNTARESLVDEAALLEALQSGALAGAAMDVNEQDGPWRKLVALPNFTLTPHLGGATFETLARGADMAVAEVQRFVAGDQLRWAR